MISFLALTAALAQSALFPHIPDAYRSKWNPDAVAMKVDGVEIKRGDLAGWLWDWRGHEVVEEALQLYLVERDAAARSVSVDRQEADLEFAKRIEQARKGVGNRTLEEVMKEQGFSLSRLYARLRIDLLTQKVLDRMFKAEDYVKVSTLVFPAPSGSVDDLQKAIAAANQAYEKLQKGEKWAKVLAGTNPTPAVAKSEGLIGWRLTEVFPAEIQSQLKAAGPGQVFKPVATSNGIQIFRLEQQGKSANPAEAADLKETFLEEARPAYYKGLRDKAKIELPGNSAGTGAG